MAQVFHDGKCLCKHTFKPGGLMFGVSPSWAKRMSLRPRGNMMPLLNLLFYLLYVIVYLIVFMLVKMLISYGRKSSRILMVIGSGRSSMGVGGLKPPQRKFWFLLIVFC